METKIYKTPELLAVELAEDLITKTNNKIIRGEHFRLSLSGGNTPKLFYSTLARSPFKEDISWEKVDVFWGDERCVPPDDEESNFRMTKFHLLDKIRIRQENIHRIMGESNPALEAKRYAEEIRKIIGMDKGSLPVFDFVLLGLGEDGHTASLFPDQSLTNLYENICGVGNKKGQMRISLTHDVICNSKSINFLATGKEKAQIVREIIKERKDLPATAIKPTDGELIWWLDKDAASLL